MVRAAYTSAYHWARAARRTPANEARGEWMVSHVHAVLGRADLAQHHAERCLAVVDAAGLQDFDRAYAHEALARAAAAAGRVDLAREQRAAAAAVPIADEEDRKIFVDDLASEPGTAWRRTDVAAAWSGSRVAAGAAGPVRLRPADGDSQRLAGVRMA